jgi:hypothetical protein
LKIFDKKAKPKEAFTPKQSADSKDATLDMAREAFKSAREEIMFRLRAREVITLAYLAGYFTLLSTSVANYSRIDIVFFLASVGPLAALAVSVMLYAHNKTIEQLAEFIRFDLNEFLVSNNSWAPLWDLSTRWKDTPGAKSLKDIEGGKTITRWFSVLTSVHLPSVVSLILSAYILFTCSDGKAIVLPLFTFCPNVSIGVVVLALSALSFSVALWVTWKSFQLRLNPNLPGITIPDKYIKLRDARLTKFVKKEPTRDG